MIKEPGDIRDDEIRVLGEMMRLEPTPSPRKSGTTALWVVILLAIVAVIVVIVSVGFSRSAAVAEEEPSLFEQNAHRIEYFIEESKADIKEVQLGREVDCDIGAFCEIKDTTINDIPFNIYIPHNATMSLHIGPIEFGRKDIVYATQAADVRADNGGIVGAFVLKGEPLAWGLSKKGYCASIDGKVSVGVAENSPLFEQATEKGGYFFRQYPLVKDGRGIFNNIRGKSIRRAICERNGEIFMVATSTAESFHDFIQALVDLRVSQAVYLVGSTAMGWAIDEGGALHEWGNDIVRSGSCKIPKNTSYIIWKKQ